VVNRVFTSSVDCTTGMKIQKKKVVVEKGPYEGYYICKKCGYSYGRDQLNFWDHLCKRCRERTEKVIAPPSKEATDDLNNDPLCFICGICGSEFGVMEMAINDDVCGVCRLL
jgi:rubrerythrin